MPSYYAEHAQQLKRDLAAEMPVEELRRLQQKRPLLHAAVALANIAVLALAQAPLLHAGALPDLLPRGEAGDGVVRAGAAAPHRPRAPRHDLPPARRARNHRVPRRLVDRVQALRRASLLRLPDRLRAEP